MATVTTVLGPVPASDRGVTLAHEHLLLDLSCLWSMPNNPARRQLVDAPVSADLHELLRTDPYHCRDNMYLDSAEIAAEELGHVAALGGRTVMDLSTRAIGPYPKELATIARHTGLHIVAGCGFYTRRAHPAWVQDVCTKMQWRRLGGRGYDHLLRSVVPTLRARGVPESALALILVRNPARLLSGEEITTSSARPA